MQTKFIHQPHSVVNDDGGFDENDGPTMNNQLVVSKDPTGHDTPGNVVNNNNQRLPDPIYYTIASDKGYAQKPMMRNCVSLENLGGLTIRNDLTPHTDETSAPLSGNNAAALAMLQHHQPQMIMNNARMFSGFGQMYQQYPPLANMQYNDYWNWSRFGYGGGGVGGGGGGVFNHLNPYVQNRSNTNSKQSLGSDDYRKYRDVAL